MKKKVGIVGISQTRHESAKQDTELAEMIFEVTSGALEDARLTIKDIDSVVLAAHDLIDGRSISSMLTAPPAGCHLKDEIRLGDDGAFAVALAWMRLLSGEFSTSLVVSWSKLSEGDFDAITSLNFDPMFYRPLGFNYVTAHSLQAMRFMAQSGVTETQAARVTVKNRSNARNNPLAHLRESVGLDDVLNSKLLAWPLKHLDLPPATDGACAMVLTTEENIKQTNNVAWIKGVGWTNDTYYLGDKELGELSSLRFAAQRAYRMAGIDDPLEQLDVAEVHDLSSFHELMAYEALGFCRKGEAGMLIDREVTSVQGKLPVNPSGGALSSHPYTAVGLIRVAEAAMQVIGSAEGHQVPGVETALAHGASGMCGQANCVLILGK